MRHVVVLNTSVMEQAKAVAKGLANTPSAAVLACLAQAQECWRQSQFYAPVTQWRFFPGGFPESNQWTDKWYGHLDETAVWMTRALRDIVQYHRSSRQTPRRDGGHDWVPLAAPQKVLDRTWRFLATVVHALQQDQRDPRANEIATLYAEYLAEQVVQTLQSRMGSDSTPDQDLLAQWLRISARVEERLSRLYRESALCKKERAAAILAYGSKQAAAA